MKPTDGPRQHQSMHSSTYTAAGGLTAPQTLLSPTELTSMYTRQFANSKTAAPSIYHAAIMASTDTAGQTNTHGLTVLQSARSRGPVDPHVYRDWLIFEERLKQSFRRLQRKKRSYLVQILAFGILVLYFAWFGVFGTPSYRFTCKLLSAGSAYCTYLIVTNRRFLQSVKYPAQCNRALHQFRLRFETTALQVHCPPMATAGATASARLPPNATSTATATAAAAAATTPTRGDMAKEPEALVESQLSFFPTVPRQLRDGYIEFKATYYRKRDAAKKRMQDRLRRTKKRRDSVGSSSFRTSERRPRQRRSPRGADSDHNDDTHGSSPLSLGARSGRIGVSALLGGADSATDDSSTTASSLLSHKLTNRRATERIRSSLIHALPTQDSSSESEAQSAITPPSP
ncbi:hypothetical protein LPJ63_000274 [Coemansia sp. RSA 2711]|nr:hypothetical protein LPJ63_000274 [Coemansia sp. RSA 2711]KAJ1845890.1 hypothetical protein LPJ70_002304 [Coemansia sp. RSA 2708]KAJ2738474.1 hypothetical protein H4R23_001124 [Coemansia sp. Cherry 401B]